MLFSCNYRILEIFFFQTNSETFLIILLQLGGVTLCRCTIIFLTCAILMDICIATKHTAAVTNGDVCHFTWGQRYWRIQSQVGHCWITGKCICNTYRYCQITLQVHATLCSHRLVSLWSCQQVVSSNLDFCQSDEWKMVSKCDLNLYLSYEYSWPCFHVV